MMSSTSDLAGSYFVARPLKEKYDNLVKRVGELRAEIDDARIDEAAARREVDRLQAEIDEAIRAIDKAKLYVPGATVQNRAATRSIPLGPGDLLLVEAENVEIRGGDGPEVKCVVKKTVLGEIGKEQDLTPDFDGIELVVRQVLGSGDVRLLQDRRRPARPPARIRAVPLQAVPRSRVHRGQHQGPDARRGQPADQGGVDERRRSGAGSAAIGGGTPSCS